VLKSIASDGISGLGFRPIPTEHEGSSLIWYNATSEDNHKNWTMELETFLEGRYVCKGWTRINPALVLLPTRSIVFWNVSNRVDLPSSHGTKDVNDTMQTLLKLKKAVFWNFTPCDSCKNTRFGGTSVLTRATRLNIPEDGIVLSHRRENLKSYTI
jgi:hypothetical protein